MTATSTSLHSATDFRRELYEAIGTDDFADTRLCRLLANPRTPQTLVRKFAERVHAGAVQFCGILAMLVAHAPDAEAKAVLLENLLGEEGLHVIPGRGIVAMPEQRHAEWSARFVRACGGDPSAVAEALAGVKIKSLIDSGRWLDAVSFLLVGQESSFGRSCISLAAALQARGLRDADLIFFHQHTIADAKHGSEALDLVVTRATHREQQLSALAAATEGAQLWRAAFESAPAAAQLPRQS